MKKVIRLNETDLTRIVKRIVNEQTLKKPSMCPQDMTIIKQMLSRDSQFNIQVDQKNPNYVIFTPQNKQYPPFACSRNQIFNID